jgi:hypothetical protein
MMIHLIGVEDIEPGHWVAWDFACPGLRGKGDTSEAAVKALAQVLGDEVQVVEVFNGYFSDEDPEYYVNAFFEDDKRPLDDSEIARGLAMLAESRQVLKAVIAEAKDYLNVEIPGEKFGSINGILRHAAIAEWWYCDRLDGVANWGSLPQESRAALEVSRANTCQFLPGLVGDTRIVTLVGETWSARKVLRRAVWHERDHIGHIRELLKRLVG